MSLADIAGTDRTAFPVTAEAALEDRSWFSDHPERRFRGRPGAGGIWIIRRRPQGAGADVLLRTFSRTISPPSRDGDSELVGLWFMAAYPDWPVETVQKAGRKALRKAGSRR